MQTKFIEASNGPKNWGKFAVGRFDDDEWRRPSAVAKHSIMRHGEAPLLEIVGWTPKHIHVLDLQTGEGAIFRPGGLATADLEKHRVWVCPLFEPFLEWLYKQDLSDISALPDHVDLPNAPFAFSGYRRTGPDGNP